VSKVLLSLAGKNADGILSVTPLIDPSDPANDAKPAVKTYKEQVKKYAPKDTDVTDGIVAYGWTTAALFAKILDESPTLTRSAVMETARTLPDVKDVGLQLPGSTWATSADDWFVGETFQLIKYDATAGHSVNVGSLIDDNGKTADLSPKSLLTQ
jgi:hypothetical protein